jgi:hypothetical protein
MGYVGPVDALACGATTPTQTITLILAPTSTFTRRRRPADLHPDADVDL